MLVEVKVPVLAESVPDATLLEWHKKSGERVERGDNLIDLETDKVTLEIAAPVGGVLVDIRKQTGEVVTTDEILAVIDTAEASTAPDAAPLIAAGTDLPTDTAVAAKMGPAARKIVQERGLDVTTIQGSGKDGRVTKGDVLAQTVSAPARVVPPQAPAPGQEWRTMSLRRVSSIRPATYSP